MRFIKLTWKVDQSALWVNPAHVMYMYAKKQGGSTVIQFTEYDIELEVEETPEEIFDRLREASA